MNGKERVKFEPDFTVGSAQKWRCINLRPAQLEKKPSDHARHSRPYAKHLQRMPAILFYEYPRTSSEILGGEN
jgi:hypothetical protein